MPQPKKKTSHSKQGHTRHHWKAKTPDLVKCKNTGEMVPRRLYRYYNEIGLINKEEG